MKIIIKTTGLDLTPSFQAFIEEKMGGLGKLLGKFEADGEAELRVEVGRTTRHHRHGEVFMAEANLALPKKLLRAVEEGENARKAVDLLRTTLRGEIEKYKAKLQPRRSADA